MKILVTGGLGFLGSSVALALASASHEVTIFDDGSRGSVRTLNELQVAIPVLKGDIRDLDAVSAACSGVDIVVHLAAVQGTATFYREPDRVLDVNVTGAINVATACARLGVRRCVFASSSEVYATPLTVPTSESAPLIVPDPTNPRFSYSSSKIIGEVVTIQFARRHAFEYTIVRPHNVYGPRMGWDHVIPQFIERIERGVEFTVQGDGTQTRAFCYIDDATDAVVRATLRGEAANEIFNIGSPDERTINELVEMLSVIAGKTVVPHHVALSEGSVERRCPDIAHIRARLGFEPRVPLRDGLAKTYAWYRAAIQGDLVKDPPLEGGRPRI